MNCPTVPWKNVAAMGGTVIRNRVISNPRPPCCIAMLLTPWGEALAASMVRYWAAYDTATAPSSFEIIETVKLSTASENMVPMPHPTQILK